MKLGYFIGVYPTGLHVFKNDKCAGGKPSRERLTVSVTASMVGEKLPPLDIGKSANPRVFQETL